MRYQSACLTACLLLNLCFLSRPARAQLADDKSTSLASGYAETVHRKIAKFDQQTQDYSRSTLDQIIRVEQRMRSRVAATDPSFPASVFTDAIDSIRKMKAALASPAALTSAAGKLRRLTDGSYFPYADTLRQTLAFLQKDLGPADALEARLGQVATIRNFIQHQKGVLNGVAAKFPQCISSLQQLNKTAYYYSAQMAQYKSMLKDPAAIERRMLDLVEGSPVFQNLMEKNGRLAGLFAPRSAFTPFALGGGGSSAATGLPGRTMLAEYVKKNMPLSADTADPLSQLQPTLLAAGDRLHQSGGTPGIPQTQSFIPNTQRIKPFRGRMEYGADIQFGRAISYLPATADIGISAGYRLNDHLSMGIGFDYLVGMGTGWKDIHISSQGIGIRSYGKWLYRKGWSARGGLEFNYMTAFSSIAQLKALPNWQTQALLGVSKQYRVSRKVSGDVQVLYDFLYRQHLPNTQPLIFRLGYNLK